MNSGQSMCGRNSVCTSADFRLSPETWKQRNKTQQRLPIISSYVQCSTTLMLPISLGMPIHCFTDFAWEPLNLCGYWWIGSPSQKMTHMGEQKYWNSGACNIKPPKLKLSLMENRNITNFATGHELKLPQKHKNTTRILLGNGRPTILHRRSGH